MNILAITEADGLALTLMAVLVISFSFILVLLIAILRQRKRHDHEVEDLLDEIHRDDDYEEVNADASEAPERQPWERDSDWWKKG